MVELASDFLDRNTPVFRDDVCFFISQSGENPTQNPVLLSSDVTGLVLLDLNVSLSFVPKTILSMKLVLKRNLPHVVRSSVKLLIISPPSNSGLIVL